MGILPDLRKFEDAMDDMAESQEKFLELLMQIRDLLVEIRDAR